MDRCISLSKEESCISEGVHNGFGVITPPGEGEKLELQFSNYVAGGLKKKRKGGRVGGGGRVPRRL